jgi:hypothetical protein
MVRAGICALSAAVVLLAGCGNDDAAKARNTASTFMDALADGDGYACDQSSIDTLRLCYTGETFPEFRAAQISSVSAGSNAIDASSNPVGTVTAHVSAGTVRLHLQSTDSSDWYVEGIATSFAVPPLSAQPLKRGVVPPS